MAAAARHTSVDDNHVIVMWMRRVCEAGIRSADKTGGRCMPCLRCSLFSVFIVTLVTQVVSTMVPVAVVVLALCVCTALAQVPAPCITPTQLTTRASQYDHLDDVMNRYVITYDAINKRRVIFEEQNVVTPGRQFREYLILSNLNVMYEINLTLKTCQRSVPRPWRPYGIPANATFETEYYIGGPGEQLFTQEWSDRIPYRQREYWIGAFTVLNCYPVREVIIADAEQVNSTITTNFYDTVEGILNPDDFIPPPECQNATWMKPRNSNVHWL